MYYPGVGQVDQHEAEELRAALEQEQRDEYASEKEAILEDIALLGSLLKEEGGKDEMVAALRDLYRAVKTGRNVATVQVYGRPRGHGNWVYPSLVHRGLRETRNRF